MIRIAGVNLDSKKQVRFALTPIKGIGKNNVKNILQALNIPFNVRLQDLDDDTINQLRRYIEENYITEAELIRQQKANIKRLIDIGCYRGLRHKNRLPVRGQTTRTNSRTVRGNVRHTGPSGRAKAPSKT
jgi:small subunit ribosomal protein S13